MALLLEKDQVGKREALLNYITNVDAHETPLLSMLPKGSDPRNTLIDWQVDNFSAPRIAGVRDGEDATQFANKAENRKLLSGRMMKIWRPFAVGDKAQNVSDVAGVTNEYAKAQTKALIELKRDIEATLGGVQDSTEETGVVGAVTRGMGSWISNSAQTDLPVNSTYRTPSASINTTATASLTEANVNAVLKSLWGQSGSNQSYVGVVGFDLKERFSSFTRYMPDVGSNTIVRQYNANSDSKKVCNVVSVYESDGGTIELMLSNYLNISEAGVGDVGQGYVVKPEHWETRFNRLPRHMALPDQGGGPRGLVDAIFGLVCKNPLGSAKFDPA